MFFSKNSTPAGGASQSGMAANRASKGRNVRTSDEKISSYDRRMRALLFPLLLGLSVAGAQTTQTPNPVFAPIQDVPGLPRVLLIGDSISVGYTLPVRKLLEGKANVHRIPVNAQHTRFR